jgi:hypothetical protein
MRNPLTLKLLLNSLGPARLKKVARFEPESLHLTRTEQRQKEVSERAADLV